MKKISNCFRSNLMFLLLILFVPAFVYGQVTQQQIDAFKGTSTGTDTYSVTISGITAIVPYDGQKIWVKFGITNTGAATLRVNSYTARAITLNGSALTAGQILANQYVGLIYYLSGTSWQVQSPSDVTGTVSSVTVTPNAGVTGVVTNPTTTPSIAVSLGAITPTTINGNTISTGTGTLTIAGSGVTITSNGTGGGNWSAGGTWIGGIVPTIANNVVIVDGDGVVVDINSACNKLTIQADGNSGLGSPILQINANIIFTVNTDVDFSMVNAASTTFLILSAPDCGRLVMGGHFTHTTTGGTVSFTLNPPCSSVAGSYGSRNFTSPSTGVVPYANGGTASASTPTSGTVLRGTGSVWSPTSFTIPSSVAQGDILYGISTNSVIALSKNTTATRYLSNTGTSNNPAYAQVDLTNGVVNTLPLANGGTNNTLGNAVNVTGVVAPANGGTGVANNAASLQTISGNYPLTTTLTSTTTITLPTSGTIYGTATESITSSQLATSLSNESGSGLAIFQTSPTIATPSISATDWANANHTHLGATTGGTITIASISDLPTVASGTYTPTLTNSVNIAASTAYLCQWLRIGNCVTVSGLVRIQQTTTLLTSTLLMSLPIASNLTTAQLGGTAISYAGPTFNCSITSGSGKAEIDWAGSVGTGNNFYGFTFTYWIN